MARKILIPVDGSDNSLNAFQWYAQNIKKEGDYIYFIHIVDPPVLQSLTLTSGMNIPVDEWAKEIQSGIAKANKLNDDYSVRCLEQKLKMEFYPISAKTPGGAICDFIEEKQIDQVVIGNRGMGMLKRALLGSVSDYVLHNAAVPITVVPPTKV